MTDVGDPKEHHHQPHICRCGVPLEVDGWDVERREQRWKASGRRSHLNLRSTEHTEALANAMPGHAPGWESAEGHHQCQAKARGVVAMLLADSKP